MRADRNVDFAGLQLRQRFLDLLGCAEAAEHLDLERKGCETAAEGIEVLEGQHSRRSKHGHLSAVLQRLERRAHGDFGLAVAHIAAEQTVHRRRSFHVALHVDDRVHLVFGLAEFECVFELALPLRIGAKGCPWALLLTA